MHFLCKFQVMNEMDREELLSRARKAGLSILPTITGANVLHLRDFEYNIANRYSYLNQLYSVDFFMETRQKGLQSNSASILSLFSLHNAPRAQYSKLITTRRATVLS